MKIINTLTNLNEKHSGVTIALGTFDGIHMGHQKIISRAVDVAKQIGGTSVVFTFSNHPLSIIAPERCPLQLVTQDEKAELIAELGVDILLTLPFTTQFLHISAAEFINLALMSLDPKHIVVGPNYFFGHKRMGTPEILRQAGKSSGFEVEIHPAVHVNDKMVSSTLIRQLVAKGHVDKIPPFLGRPFKIKGPVIHGAKRGRGLGYPTVNVDIETFLSSPPNGVYAVYISIDNISYKGIANIGNNPTFHETKRRLEVHIFDFSGDLYGQSVTVSFLKHIRGQLTFSSVDDLKMQISHDIEKVQQYYKK